MNYLNTMLDELNSNPLILTPAQKQGEEEFIINCNNALNNGLEPNVMLNMTYIIALINKKGLSIEKIENNIDLLLHLCTNSNYSTTDTNIDYIVDIMMNI
jgi:hypothetical protein